jgi:hypothetical protein
MGWISWRMRRARGWATLVREAIDRLFTRLEHQ